MQRANTYKTIKHMEKLINTLNEIYTAEPENFDFNASMYIAGKDKEQTRRDILTLLNGGNTPPKSKSSFYHCVNALKIKFNQPEIQFC